MSCLRRILIRWVNPFFYTVSVLFPTFNSRLNLITFSLIWDNVTATNTSISLTYGKLQTIVGYISNNISRCICGQWNVLTVIQRCNNGQRVKTTCLHIVVISAPYRGAGVTGGNVRVHKVPGAGI